MTDAPTVTAVRTTPFRIPLMHEVRFSTGRLTSAEHVLVEVDVDGGEAGGGITGFAEAIPRPMIYGETTVSVCHIVESTIGPALTGLKVTELQTMAERLRHLAGNHTARGAAELAMYDALGKSFGISCHQLLGGAAESVTATVILGAGPVEAVVEESVALRDTHGIRSFKIKVGMDLERDVTLAARLRDQHPGAVLYVDANHGYTSAQALEFLRRTLDTGLAWIEEPCPAEDVLGRQQVLERSPIPVLGDESCTTVREVATEVLGRRCSMISIKLARTGILASTRIREFCGAVGAQPILGSQGDSGIGTYISAAFAAAHPNTAGVPAELGYFLGLAGDVLTTPPVIDDGVLAVPPGPGFGTAVDRDQLARFRFDA